MGKTVVITGAGSGVGQAVALALAGSGWSMALVGRRAEALRETAELVQAANPGATCAVLPCDVGNRDSVIAMGKETLAILGHVDALVNAAGTNTPRRSLAVLAQEDYDLLVNSNLNGAYWCVQAFLPGMRERKSGTIVNIISEAGRQANAKAGVAYVISKFGMAGLTQSINAEERTNGIRACALYPGDIDTPILSLRPAPPSAEARSRMLQAEDVARCVALVLELPPRAIVEELLIRPA